MMTRMKPLWHMKKNWIGYRMGCIKTQKSCTPRLVVKLRLISPYHMMVTPRSVYKANAYRDPFLQSTNLFKNILVVLLGCPLLLRMIVNILFFQVCCSLCFPVITEGRLVADYLVVL